MLMIISIDPAAAVSAGRVPTPPHLGMVPTPYKRHCLP